MMDDLDNLHVKTHVLSQYWAPIITETKTVHPGAFFVAEQSDWGSGSDCLTKGNADSVFAFPLYSGIRSFNKELLRSALFNPKVDLRKQFVFIENHDVERFASFVQNDPAHLRLGAILNLTVPGTPIIYYGQELGMKGTQGKWNSDANDIPVRLAYRWNNRVDGPGAANFYRKSGPWDSTGFVQDNDGVSVQEEDRDPNSLLNFYRQLIQLRRTSPSLLYGPIEELPLRESHLFGYRRVYGEDAVTVILNLGNAPQSFQLPKEMRGWFDVIHKTRLNTGQITLASFQAVILKNRGN